jgi:hypothetical protein
MRFMIIVKADKNSEGVFSLARSFLLLWGSTTKNW